METSRASAFNADDEGDTTSQRSNEQILLQLVEHVAVPQLRSKRHWQQSPLRVWLVGCGTGELAYAIAILLQGLFPHQSDLPAIEMFATDSDESVLQYARQGGYGEKLAGLVSEAQLKQFFLPDERGYRAKPLLRQLIIFAHHHLTRDPPFIHIDLIICPKLFAPLLPPAREHVLRMFYYSLQVGGFLLVGEDGLADTIKPLFTPLEGNTQLFARAEVLNFVPNVVYKPSPSPNRATDPSEPTDVEPTAQVYHRYIRHLGRYAPISMLVNEQYDILHVSRHDEQLVSIEWETLPKNVLQAIPQQLQNPLHALFIEARQTGMRATFSALQLRFDDDEREIRLSVQPIFENQHETCYFIVTFHEQQSNQRLPDPQQKWPDRLRFSVIEDQLTATRHDLAVAINQYEDAIKQHRVANEDLQATNEELRVMTEELRTSQEELTSVNEELTSVNDELHFKIEEAVHARNDLQNLMDATDIGTLFTDRQLRLTRFTPGLVGLFNLISGDLYRPLKHITHSLDYDTLIGDAEHVLATLQPVEREIPRSDGRWYLARLRPYRTLDQYINGVVITFVDITDRKQNEHELRIARDELEQRVAERTVELAHANAQLQNEVNERRQVMDARVQLERERTELLHKLVTAQEEERSRIARELHDQFGQTLTALRVGLAGLHTGDPQPEALVASIARLQQIAAQLDEDVDRLALELRPGTLDDLGLLTTLQHHLEEWAAHAGMPVDFQSIGFEQERLSAEREIVLYRVAQEALTNILKHAEAQHVSVILERRQQQVLLIIEDDGRGFDLDGLEDLPDAQRRLGLLGMRERVALVDGTCNIESEPGSGTTVIVRIPL